MDLSWLIAFIVALVATHVLWYHIGRIDEKRKWMNKEKKESSNYLTTTPAKYKSGLFRRKGGSDDTE